MPNIRYAVWVVFCRFLGTKSFDLSWKEVRISKMLRIFTWNDAWWLNFLIIFLNLKALCRSTLHNFNDNWTEKSALFFTDCWIFLAVPDWWKWAFLINFNGFDRPSRERCVQKDSNAELKRAIFCFYFVCLWSQTTWQDVL